MVNGSSKFDGFSSISRPFSTLHRRSPKNEGRSGPDYAIDCGVCYTYHLRINLRNPRGAWDSDRHFSRTGTQIFTIGPPLRRKKAQMREI